MQIFSSDSKGVSLFGPTASVTVNVEGFSEVNESWFLTDLYIGASEIVDVRQCFDDVSFIYALGNNQSECAMSLSFAAFIGRENCRGGDLTKTLQSGLENYVSNRISEHTSRSAITIGSLSKMGWLTKISIGRLDAERGICYVTINFIMELDS